MNGELAGTAQVAALLDDEDAGDGDCRELAQVAAERDRGGAGGGVFADAAERERVARGPRAGRVAVDDLDRGPALANTDRAERGES